MTSSACMCRWGTAIVQTYVLRDRGDSSEALCLYGFSAALGRLSPWRPQFHAREPSVGHSAWTAWRACPSRSQCLRIQLRTANTCPRHQRHQRHPPRSTFSAKELLGAPHCPQALHAPMPLPDLDCAAAWCGHYFMNLTLAHIRQVLYAVCCAKRSCLGGWNLPVSHLWKGLIFRSSIFLGNNHLAGLSPPFS